MGHVPAVTSARLLSSSIPSFVPIFCFHSSSDGWGYFSTRFTVSPCSTSFGSSCAWPSDVFCLCMTPGLAPNWGLWMARNSCFPPGRLTIGLIGSWASRGSCSATRSGSLRLWVGCPRPTLWMFGPSGALSAAVSLAFPYWALSVSLRSAPASKCFLSRNSPLWTPPFLGSFLP